MYLKFSPGKLIVSLFFFYKKIYNFFKILRILGSYPRNINFSFPSKWYVLESTLENLYNTNDFTYPGNMRKILQGNLQV